MREVLTQNLVLTAQGIEFGEMGKVYLPQNGSLVEDSKLDHYVGMNPSEYMDECRVLHEVPVQKGRDPTCK